MREIRADEIEFLAMTRWASLDAIRAFAGEMLDKAVAEPGAVAALERFDATVRHYESAESADA